MLKAWQIADVGGISWGFLQEDSSRCGLAPCVAKSLGRNPGISEACTMQPQIVEVQGCPTQQGLECCKP